MEAAPGFSVFLSHSSRDKEFVRRLSQDLVSHGIRTWLDEAEIHPGDDFVSKIGEGLSKATHVVIVLSPDSVQSAWVQEEIHASQIRAAQGEIQLLPVLLGDLKTEQIPILLRAKQFIDFRDPSGYLTQFARLLAALHPEIPHAPTENGRIFLPRFEDAHIITGKKGAGLGVELLLVNPSSSNRFIQRASIGCYRLDATSHAVPPPVYKYELNFTFHVSSNSPQVPVSGTVQEPGDEWARPSTGSAAMSGDAFHFAATYPFYLELLPRDRLLIRFLFGLPEVARGMNSVPGNTGEVFNQFKQTLLNTEPIGGTSGMSRGYTWVILEGDFDEPLVAKLSDDSLIQLIGHALDDIFFQW